MSDRVTVIVGHRVGKVEAVRRLKEGFARTKGHLGEMIAIEQETWESDTLRFRMRALGQTAAGTIEVLEDALRIEVSLPWLLAKAANCSSSIAQGSDAAPGEEIVCRKPSNRATGLLVRWETGTLDATRRGHVAEAALCGAALATSQDLIQTQRLPVRSGVCRRRFASPMPRSVRVSASS